MKTRGDLINWICLLLEWSLIGLCIILNLHFQNSYLFLISIFFIGSRIHALGILMHEASHSNLFSNKITNDLAAQISISIPALISFKGYRDSHLLHHQHNQTEQDPTFTRKRGKFLFQFPKTQSKHLAALLTSVLFGFGAATAVYDLKRNWSNGRNEKIWLKLVPTGLIFGSLAYFSLWPIYFKFWLLPALTVLPLLNYWRTIAEHSGLATQLEKTRTVVYHPLTAWLIAPYNISYHLEHHLYPKDKWFNLKQRHFELLKSPKKNSQYGKITYGLKGLWSELVGAHSHGL